MLFQSVSHLALAFQQHSGHTHTHTNKQKYKHACTHMHAYTNRNTQTETHKQKHTNRNTQTETHKQKHTHAHKRSLHSELMGFSFRFSKPMLDAPVPQHLFRNTESKTCPFCISKEKYTLIEVPLPTYSPL